MKSPLSDEDVQALLETVDRVVVARGQKRVEVAATEVALDELKGRSGKFRAPLLVVGDTMLVGFNEAVFSGF